MKEKKKQRNVNPHFSWKKETSPAARQSRASINYHIDKKILVMLCILSDLITIHQKS
jgi:hypothetical protein